MLVLNILCMVLWGMFIPVLSLMPSCIPAAPKCSLYRREHCRALPAARKAVLRPVHACRIEYFAGIRVLVPGPELLDPTCGYVHGLGNMVGGGSISLLGYDPPYLGFRLVFFITRNSSAAYVSPQPGVSWPDPNAFIPGKGNAHTVFQVFCSFRHGVNYFSDYRTNYQRAASYRHNQTDQIGRVNSSSCMPVGHSPTNEKNNI